MIAALVAGFAAPGVRPSYAGELEGMELARRRKKRRRRRRRRPKDNRPPAVEPADASKARKPFHDKANELFAAGDPYGAGRELDRGAAEIGDPVLFLDAAAAYVEVGRQHESAEYVETGIDRARIALDILYFIQSHGDTERYHPVHSASVPAKIAQANDLIAQAQPIVEQWKVEEEVPVDRSVRLKRWETASYVVGGIFGAVGIAGLGVGIYAQNRVDSPIIYGSEYDKSADVGKLGNVGAYVGLSAAVVFTGVGLTLRALRKKSKSAGDDASPDAATAGVRVLPTFRGVALQGAF